MYVTFSCPGSKILNQLLIKVIPGLLGFKLHRSVSLISYLQAVLRAVLICEVYFLFTKPNPYKKAWFSF